MPSQPIVISGLQTLKKKKKKVKKTQKKQHVQPEYVVRNGPQSRIHLPSSLTSAKVLERSVTPPLAWRYFSLVSASWSWAMRNSLSRCSSWLFRYFSRDPIFSRVWEISSCSLSRCTLVSVSEVSMPSRCWCICSRWTRQSWGWRENYFWRHLVVCAGLFS